MSSLLKNVAKRFEISFRVIEPVGPAITFLGVLDEPASGTPPSITFTNPRRLLRVRSPSLASIGQAIETPHGDKYLMAKHGTSELPGVELFDSFLLYEVTHQLLWERRLFEFHPVSRVEIDKGYQNMGFALGAIEPEREVYDRGFSASFEAARFITNAAVLKDDRIEGRKVVRVDTLLGVNIVELEGG